MHFRLANHRPQLSHEQQEVAGRVCQAARRGCNESRKIQQLNKKVITTSAAAYVVTPASPAMSMSTTENAATFSNPRQLKAKDVRGRKSLHHPLWFTKVPFLLFVRVKFYREGFLCLFNSCQLIETINKTRLTYR